MPGFSTQPKANPLSPKLLLKVYFTSRRCCSHRHDSVVIVEGRAAYTEDISTHLQIPHFSSAVHVTLAR
jgi:hypothetical protein